MNNNTEKFEYLSVCPYCHSSNFSHFLSAPDRFSDRTEIFSAVKCSECGLVFQNPRVKEEFIAGYYGEGDDLGYYNIPTEKKRSFLSRVKSGINKQVLIQHFKYNNIGKKNILFKILTLPFKKISKIKSIPKFVPGGKILEIGCSHGALLRELKDLGWDVQGIEMSEKMAEYARSIDLNVSGKRIEDNDYGESSFDVIIMNMVLEHLYDPFENLKRITSWLKPGGQLIFSIPYINGVEFKVFKDYSYGLQLPHHITFLNKKIIREYLNKLGYTNTKLYFQFFDRDVVVPAQWKYTSTHSYIYKLLGYNKFVRLIFIKPIVFISSLLQKTSRVTVHAIKN